MTLTTVRYSKRAEGDITRILLSIPVFHNTIRSFSGEVTGKSKHTLFKCVDSLTGWIALVGVVRC